MKEITNKPIGSNSDKNEIDLISVIKTIWINRKKVIKTTIIFMIIGLFIAIFSQKEYTASATIVPQSSNGESIGGDLGGLAAIAGINLGALSSDSGISPVLYPQVINSLPFQKELLKTHLTINGLKEQISYETYYKDFYKPGVINYIVDYTIGLPRIIIKAFRGKSNSSEKLFSKSLLSITMEEKELLKVLKEQISLNINDKEGYITISVKMPEALAAAELTEKVKNLLQEYIINFKIQKSTEKLNFIKDRYNEKGKEFEKIQFQLAKFTDQNQQVNSSVAKTKLVQLQAQYDLIYGVYAELAKQLATQEIQVKEDTPVFAVLKPVSIPFEKSKPLRFFILMIWTLFGLVFGVVIVFGKIIINKLLVNSKNNQ